MTTEKTFTTKLGKTRNGPRSRIWIEGKRLIAAGFNPGDAYAATWNPATLTLSRKVPNELALDDSQEFRKVSGRRGNAIIDIVGDRVYDTFGAHCETVRVTYGDGVITIRKG